MSCFTKNGESRLTSAEALDRGEGEIGGCVDMPTDDEGRAIIRADSDVFPASGFVADRHDAHSHVAAFLLSSVCGWSWRQIGEALELSSNDSIQYAINHGASLMREGTVRL